MTVDKLIQTREEIAQLANSISMSGEIGFDTESYGPPLVKGKMINTSRSIPAGFSIALPDGHAYYVPVGHYRKNVPIGLCKPLFDAMGSGVAVWAHNWKHDLTVVQQMGYSIPKAALKDSMLLYWLLSSPAPNGRYGLKDLSKHYLKVDPPTFEETVGKDGFFGSLDPKSKACLAYACHDARNTLDLSLLVKNKPKTLKLEMDFMHVLHHIEASGMGINPDALEELYSRAFKESAAIEKTWNILFPGVAINSSAQIRKQLISGYEVKTNWRGVETVDTVHGDGRLWSPKGLPLTPGGQISTNRESVEIILARSKVNSIAWRAADLKLRSQDLQKIISTYTRTLIDQAMQHNDQRLHASYHQAGTATGRLSCSNPNLQNIPTRSAWGKKVKECFVPKQGHTLVVADYSQIELRVLAHYCGEGALFEAYRDGRDIHQQTADLVGCSRGQGKTINFATVYGAGPEKLGKLCGVSTKQGKEFLNKYFEAYPEITKIRECIVSEAESKGGISTVLGRFRPIPELESGASTRWRGERLAFNTPIQGGAADIMKIAMVQLYGGKDSAWDIISQVHDELTLEVPTKDVDKAKAFMQATMEGAFDLKVPLKAEPSSGSTWAEAK